MKASFLIKLDPNLQPLLRPTANQHLPRTVRKALRVTTPKRIRQTATQLDADKIVSDWLALHDPLNDKDYLCTNTTDPAFDFDEFKDIDDELDGLRITEPLNEVQLWEFCTGYNVL